MASSCARCVVSVLLVLALAIPLGGAKNERNIQSFVKIDVSKINVKNASESNNLTTTTTVTSATTEGTNTANSTTSATNITATESASTTAATTKATTTTGSPVSSTTTTTATEATHPINVDPSFPPLTEGRAAKLVPRGYFCQCDLKINTCDVNCCCDIDCSEAILQAFNCDEEQLHTDEYHHDEGLQSCRVQGGLFCLVEPIHEERDESHYDPNRLPEATRHKWKEVFPIDAAGPADVRVDHYHVGDTVYIYNDTSEAVHPFALPYSLTDSACQINHPVRFLRESSNLCRRTVDELAAYNRAFLAQHQSIRFFRTPKKSTVMEHYCVEDQECVNVTISVCQLLAEAATGWNCSQAVNATSNTNMDEFLELLETEGDGGSCGKLEINFYHNYTHLLAVNTIMFCRPNSPETWGDSFLWQRVVVNYRVASSGKHRNNSSRAVSGNLGYMTGKPIIVSHLDVPLNSTAGSGSDSTPSSENPPKPMLAYFTNGTRLPDESFRLRLPVSKANQCILSADTYQTINFGVDSWHRCNFVPDETANMTAAVSNTQNYTQFCRDLQDGLYAHLLHGVRRTTEDYDNLNLYLSKYANPINRTTDWFRVRSANVIPDAQPGSDPDSAALHEGVSDYFTCSNMLINVDYRFYYGRERVHDVRHQAILRDAELAFGPRVNLRFRRDEEIRVPIFVQVQFFDFTSSLAVNRGVSADTIFLAWFGVLCVFLVS